MIYLININNIIIKLMLLNIVINKNWFKIIFKIILNQFNKRLKILNNNQKLKNKESK